MKWAWSISLAACVAAALFVEWHTDEVTVVLAVMTVSAIALGALWPRRASFAGAVLGFSIMAAHSVTEAMGAVRPHYLHSPISAGDWMAMAVAGFWVTGVASVTGFLRSRRSVSNAL